MEAFIKQYALWITLLIIWEYSWRAWAMWIAARQSEKTWYVLLLVINSLGILSMAYIFFFSKHNRAVSTPDPATIIEAK